LVLCDSLSALPPLGFADCALWEFADLLL